MSEEKTEGPETYLVFLGFGIDSVNQSIFIPKDKVEGLQSQILEIQGKSKITLRQLQSLAGSLAYISKVLPVGRAFSCRLHGLIYGVCKPHQFVRITREIHSDLQMWLTFLHEFNGTTKFPELEREFNSDCQFYSDSSGAMGCGVVFGTSWSYLCCLWSGIWILRKI